jgi:hypothetical protein
VTLDRARVGESYSANLAPLLAVAPQAIAVDAASVYWSDATAIGKLARPSPAIFSLRRSRRQMTIDNLAMLVQSASVPGVHSAR